MSTFYGYNHNHAKCREVIFQWNTHSGFVRVGRLCVDAVVLSDVDERQLHEASIATLVNCENSSACTYNRLQGHTPHQGTIKWGIDGKGQKTLADRQNIYCHLPLKKECIARTHTHTQRVSEKNITHFQCRSLRGFVPTGRWDLQSSWTIGPPELRWTRRPSMSHIGPGEKQHQWKWCSRLVNKLVCSFGKCQLWHTV